MKALLTACASLALTLALGACSSEHSGVEATPGFDPIGSEPTSGDGGGPGSRDVIRHFCDRGCVNLAMACPTGIGVPPEYCAQSCNANPGYPGCEAEELIYYICLATTHVECPFYFPQAPECDPVLQALSMCQST